MPTEIQSHPSDVTLLGRTPRATEDSSRQIFRTWDQRIRDQATFSARTTNEAYLESVRKVLAAISSRQMSPQDGERHLKTTLQNLGYRPEAGFPDARGRVPPAKPGSITDLSSSRRIQLIIDTNVKQARSLGQVATSEDPRILLASPAWKLTRTGARKKPRGDWKRRWTAAGAACGWYGASKNNLIALKTSPIWQKLADGAGGFKDTMGSPYPPFAFGSGMAWVNYDWDDWADLCKREGIPDHLDDITSKAKELKAAETAQRRPSVAPTVRPSVQPDGNRGRVGGDVSPILGEIRRTTATPVRTTPVITQFKPDFTASLRADKAVDDAIAAIRRDRDAVVGYTQEIDRLLDACASALDRNPNVQEKCAFMVANIERYKEAITRTQTEIVALEGRVVNYGHAIASTPRPTKYAQQGPYNASMIRWVQASASTARSAHTAAEGAKLRLKAANKTAMTIMAAVDPGNVAV